MAAGQTGCTSVWSVAPIPDALPDNAVLLHIGPHKTGTTAIQGLLASAREEMREHGVTYPGRRGAHHNEARAIRGRPAGWVHDSEPLPTEKVWRRFVRQAHRAQGRVVASSEFFAQCDAEQRARVVEDLGADRLHVLVAARNPGSIALSTWQQVLRDGKAGHLDTWLQDRYRRATPGPADEGFWSWADAATLVEHWGEVLEVDRIRVVVIDEKDRDLLPTTFERLLALPEGLLSQRVPPLSNRSLTSPEAELLRRAIALTKPQLTWDEFSLFFRKGYSRRLLDARVPPRDEAKPVLPEWAADQAAAEAEWQIGRLRASGVQVVGDPENLRRVPAAADSVVLDEIPTDLAAEALAGVVSAAQSRIRSLEQALADSTAPPPSEAPATADLDRVPARELAAALRGRVAARLHRRGR